VSRDYIARMRSIGIRELLGNLIRLLRDVTGDTPAAMADRMRPSYPLSPIKSKRGLAKSLIDTDRGN